MPITPEDRARQNIDGLLANAGWLVQDSRAANITAGRGVAVREFPMKKGHGEADVLFVDGAAAGAIEAKRMRYRSATLSPKASQQAWGPQRGQCGEI